eukprot:1378485-Amorphochlora_amoeboformis.AAC.2
MNFEPNVRVGEAIIGKAEQQARFANPRVPDEHQLEQVIIVSLHAAVCHTGHLVLSNRNFVLPE